MMQFRAAHRRKRQRTGPTATATPPPTPQPATIVISLIGVPPEDYGRLKRWCGYRAGLTVRRPRPEEQVEHAENIVAYRGYLRGLVQERVERRTGDLTYCLGASLGKLEAEMAVEELARRFPRLELVEDQELTFHPNISFRGPQALWVRAA